LFNVIYKKINHNRIILMTNSRLKALVPVVSEKIDKPPESQLLRFRGFRGSRKLTIDSLHKLVPVIKPVAIPRLKQHLDHTSGIAYLHARVPKSHMSMKLDSNEDVKSCASRIAYLHALVPILQDIPIEKTESVKSKFANKRKRNQDGTFPSPALPAYKKQAICPSTNPEKVVKHPCDTEVSSPLTLENAVFTLMSLRS
jgi:hypothetical protein